MQKIALTFAAIAQLVSSFFSPGLTPANPVVPQGTVTTSTPIIASTTIKKIIKKPLPPINTKTKNLPAVVELKVPDKKIVPKPILSEKSEPFTTSTSKGHIKDLTIQGVLNWTNQARRDNGASPLLRASSVLNEVAAKRLQDMFDKQYFAHVSPTGVNPSDLATKAGYTYIAFGENIAMGIYADDQDLVDAWMHSPHHRDNILNRHYHELGVAVGHGMYQGKDTWIAVQNFGTPATACPELDESLKKDIDKLNKTISALQVQIDQAHTELSAFSPQTSAEVAEYNAKVTAYNNLVNDKKIRNSELSSLIKSYNTKIDAYNKCIKG